MEKKKKTNKAKIVLITILIIAIVILFIILNINRFLLYFYYDKNYNSMEDMIYPVYSISMLGRVMVKSYDEEYTKQLDIEQMKELRQDLKELEKLLQQKNNYQFVNNSLLFVNGKSYEEINNNAKNRIDDIIEKYIDNN